MSDTLRSGPPAPVPARVDDPPAARRGPGGLWLRPWLWLWPWLRRQARAPYVQLLVGQLCVGATAALANILMARALAPSGRGTVALLLQVSYLASQLLLLGSERSFVAGYHGSSPAAGVRAYAGLVVRPCVAALAMVAVAAAVVPPHLRPTRTVLALIAGYTMVNILVAAVRAIAIATGRYAGYLASTLLSQFLVLVIMATLLLTGVTDVAVWFFTYALANAVPTAVCAAYWLRTAGPDSPVGAARISRQRAVRREGLALLPAAVANMGMLRFDRLLLPALASTAALGLYATVATMTELVSWPLQAYADSRLGAWRAASGGRRLRVSPVLAGAVVYVVVVAPALGLATYLLIVPLFGERYGQALHLVLPLVTAASLYAISRVTLSLLIARGRNLLASAAEMVGFAASLLAYLALIPAHGALGAAYGSLIGYGACLTFATIALVARVPAVAVQPVPEEGT